MSKLNKMKKYDDLSKIEKDRVKAWRSILNQDLPLDDLSWICDNHDKLYKYFTDKYTNDNTRKMYINLLGKFCKDAGDDTSYNKYSKISSEIAKKVDKEAKKNIMSDEKKENYLSYDELIEYRDNLCKEFINNPEDTKTNEKFLLLSLYTMQPPLRMEWKDIKITDTMPPQDNQNYLYCTKQGCTIIINKDKVSDFYGKGEIPLDKKLEKIIDISLQFYPRTYVLSLLTDPTKAIGKQGFEGLMKSIFSPKNVTLDVLRSAYVNKVYKNFDKMSYEDQELLAKYMRHSVNTAMINYKKIGGNKKVEKQRKTYDDDELFNFSEKLLKKLKLKHINIV